MNKKLGTAKNLTEKDLEEVLVVAREALFPGGGHQGIKLEGLDEIMRLVSQEAQFLPRFKVEEDSTWQQIIPYLVFKYGDKYWLMKRTEKSGEKRLHNLYSLGIGGHVRREDMEGKGSLLDWAKREFEEEMNYQGEFKSIPLGLLNDDTNEVGQVHVGLVVMLEGNSGEIEIKEDHNQSGELLTLSEMEKYFDQMENWSKIVFETLRRNDKN